MNTPRSVTIVGAGLAGHATAKALRKLGFDQTIKIIGAEQHRPYDRPPLSKEYLLGELDEDHLHLERHDEDLGAEWLLGRRAVSLDAERRMITLDDGQDITADAVVIATGSRARRLPALDGAGLGGVHYLRTLEDARALRADLEPGASMVIVGAGFIGSEVASASSRLGLAVTVLEATATPLEAALGPDAGRLVAQLHARNDVDLRTSSTVRSVHGGSRISAVELADGSTVTADLAVVGIGATPDIEWLEGSGLALTPGVRTDQHGATELPGIYAVGDSSAWWDPLLERHIRIEHWTEAKDRPAIVAARILGAPLTEMIKAPYFWSDQYGVRIEFAGRRWGDEDFVITSGSLDQGELMAEYRRDDQVVGILGINRRREFARLRRSLIISRS
jgi:NADPH-dependent 2,4-dienoyl-CoA reductase/sulfur reductase-like enzyme